MPEVFFEQIEIASACMMCLSRKVSRDVTAFVADRLPAPHDLGTARVARAREERKPQPTLLAWAGELLGSTAGAGALEEATVFDLLSDGRVVLYCDALDEIFDSDLRHTTAEQIAQLAAQAPQARIV